MKLPGEIIHALRSQGDTKGHGLVFTQSQGLRDLQILDHRRRSLEHLLAHCQEHLEIDRCRYDDRISETMIAQERRHVAGETGGKFRVRRGEPPADQGMGQ